LPCICDPGCSYFVWVERSATSLNLGIMLYGAFVRSRRYTGLVLVVCATKFH
jgi:hypothetical protein